MNTKRHFYEYNKEMKFSNWKKDKWVSNLDAKLENIHSFVNSENKDPEQENFDRKKYSHSKK